MVLVLVPSGLIVSSPGPGLTQSGLELSRPGWTPLDFAAKPAKPSLSFSLLLSLPVVPVKVGPSLERAPSRLWRLSLSFSFSNPNPTLTNSTCVFLWFCELVLIVLTNT